MDRVTDRWVLADAAVELATNRLSESDIVIQRKPSGALSTSWASGSGLSSIASGDASAPTWVHTP
jgi:hypothetical protein